MKKTLLTSVALLALVSGSALAADLPTRKAPLAPTAYAPVFTWTGFYVGATAGAVSNTGNFNNAGPDSYEYYYSGDKLKTSSVGALAGVTAGYNYQIGALVLGLETDISFSSAKGSANFYGGMADWGVTVRQQLTSLGTVRARAGYAVDRALFFVTGGLAYGNVKAMAFDYDWMIYNKSQTRTGWTVGGGVEYALTNNWTVKAEGLYYDLGKKTGFAGVIDESTYSYKDSATGLVARVGLNYKF